MSSTNRGAVRNASDFYPTPMAAFEPLLHYIKQIPTPIWEPAQGDGRLVARLQHGGWKADGDDLINGYDFLKDHTDRATIITNPPFSLALEFCQHAVKMSPNVFMLLRLNFLASVKRRAWFQANEPTALFVLSKRPCFTDDGKTDSCDYAWFAWTPYCRGIYHL